MVILLSIISEKRFNPYFFRDLLLHGFVFCSTLHRLLSLQVLFTYNEQDDVTLHYLKTFDKKNIMAAENYFSVDREPMPTEPKDDSTETQEASGM